MGPPSRIPSLGARGEGWVVLQMLCLLTVAVVGALNLPAALADPGSRIAPIVTGAILCATGGLVAYFGIADLGRSLSALPRPHESAVLVEHGVYSWIRHPIYAGLIELAVGWAAITGSLPALFGALALAVILDLKSRREEAWLRERFAGYGAYARRTRRFIPWIY